MDLASVVAALASVGVRVSGSTPNSSVQVDSSRACPTGLAGPEPSGTINDPGQHFHGSRGYLNVVPLVSQPQLAPQYGPVDSAAPGDVTITLPWCCANEALRGMPCASPSCPRRAQISSCGDPNYHPNPSRNWPSSSWNLPAYAMATLRWSLRTWQVPILLTNVHILRPSTPTLTTLRWVVQVRYLAIIDQPLGHNGTTICLQK